MSGRFSSEQLKKLAMGTMLLDHAAATIIYSYGLNDMSPLLEYMGIAMRLVGRMAFPLYAFLLVQGFMWTHDWRKYVARVAVFALVSEIPFDLVVAGEIWYSRAQNTMFVLLIGLICMKMLETLEQQFEFGSGRSGNKVLGIALAVWTIAAAMFAAEVLRGDYGAQGVLLIVVLYVFRHRPMEQIAAGCFALVLIYHVGINVLFAWIAFFFVSRYNGERGRKLGLLPYAFYPVHLLAVYFVGVLIAANIYVALL